MADYGENAVVNDPLFAKPLVGKPAIMVHKNAEMIALTDVEMNVTDRWMMGNDLIATWEVTGLHSGAYYDLPATNNRIFLTGATVVTRDKDGLIAQETLYYDAADMYRQLTGQPPTESADAESADAESAPASDSSSD